MPQKKGKHTKKVLVNSTRCTASGRVPLLGTSLPWPPYGGRANPEQLQVLLYLLRCATR